MVSRVVGNNDKSKGYHLTIVIRPTNDNYKLLQRWSYKTGQGLRWNLAD